MKDRKLDHEVLEDADGVADRFEVPNASIVIGSPEGVTKRLLPEPGQHDVFEVASLSKTATAMAVMRLVEQGRMGLDDPVAEHLQSWRLSGGDFGQAEVTIRRLLSHTAGLSEGVPAADLDKPIGVEELDPSMVEVLDGTRGLVPAQVVATPGQSFTYSNPGYGVLELLIEDVTGTPYNEAMRSLLFEPLGMSDTGFQNDDEVLGRVVGGHRAAGEPTRTYKRLPHAAGGMLSTGPDVAKLVSALVNPGSEGGLLTAGSLTEIASIPMAARGAFGLGDDGGYALGLARGTLPSGRYFIANNGSHEGYNALFVAVPEDRSYLVVLTNAETGLGLELELALRWFDEVIGERPTIATTFVNIRRAIDIGTVVALLVTMLFLARQALQLATKQRAVATRLQPKRLVLRTLPALALSAAIAVCFNTGTLTGSLGGLAPSRLISSSQEPRIFWLALALATTGVVATAAPPKPTP